MPIYMDRHDIPGISADHVAEAHQEDLKIQKKYNCKGLTYWFDEERGTAFCLIEAPSKEAVEEMHANAHGLVPNQILEVESEVVEAFLGRIEDPKSTDKTTKFEQIINESAVRIIMCIEVENFGKRYVSDDDNNLNKQKSNPTVLVKEIIENYGGREIINKNNRMIVSFVSASDSIECAINILNKQNNFNSDSTNGKISIRIGLSAGVPVTETDDFFGDAVRSAHSLCSISENSYLVLSSTFTEHISGGDLTTFEKKGCVKILSPADEKFIDKLIKVIENAWKNSAFNVEEFSQQLGLSKSQLYRKVTALTGRTPNDFIKEFRLNESLKLIEKKYGNISEVAYETGFENPSYFAKCFQKKFGILPSNYAKVITQ